MSARAQECSTPYELIFDLKDGKLGSYNIWDAIHGGVDSVERFVSAVPEEGSHNVAAGEYQKSEGAPLELLLTRQDYRGRDVWQQIHAVENLDHVVKIVPHEKGYLVAANLFNAKKSRTIWLGFLDTDGALLSSSEIKGTGDLTVKDIIPTWDGKGYLMATMLAPKGEKPRSVLYTLNSKGGVIKSRAYLPGLDNAVLGLQPVGEKQYLATGYTEAADGRKAGWVMKLNEDGSILWQQQYPRGAGARLYGAYQYNDEYIVVSGSADPAGRSQKHIGGWVMMISEFDGDVAWQRYYTGTYDYEARDVLVSDDGIVSVLLNGSIDAEEARMIADRGDEPKFDYASLLTINPRGTLIIRDAYYNGEGSGASQMYFGPKRERIIVGHTDMAYTIEAVADQPETIKHSTEGWLLAAEETEPYSDPCAR